MLEIECLCGYRTKIDLDNTVIKLKEKREWEEYQLLTIKCGNDDCDVGFDFEARVMRVDPKTMKAIKESIDDDIESAKDYVRQIFKARYGDHDG